MRHYQLFAAAMIVAAPPAWAQQAPPQLTAQQRGQAALERSLKNMLGEIMHANASLGTNLDLAQQEMQQTRTELEQAKQDLEKAKQQIADLTKRLGSQTAPPPTGQ